MAESAEGFHRYAEWSDDGSPFPAITDVGRLSLSERRTLVGRANLAASLLTQLMADEDYQVRSNAMSNPRATAGMLETALEEHPEHTAQVINQDNAPIHLLARRPVVHATTEVRRSYARSKGANEEAERLFLEAASRVPAERTGITLEHLWQRASGPFAGRSHDLE